MVRLTRVTIAALEETMIFATTRKVVLAAAALAVALALSAAAHAQVLYGTITGNVTDSTGGALAGATVQAVNVATGVSKETVTDTRGTFLFGDLIPGAYDVSFQLSSRIRETTSPTPAHSGSLRRRRASASATFVWACA